MKCSEALKLMFTHENIKTIKLPGGKENRKRTITRSSLDLGGIHINAIDFISDRWLVGIDCEDSEGGEKTIWKRSLN